MKRDTRSIASSFVPIFAALVLLVSACGDDSSARSAKSTRQTVRFALDYVPHTMLSGLYAAQEEGWFAEEGLDVQFLPHGSTPPETLVDSGAAEIGISYPDQFVYSKAAGARITSVMAILQHRVSTLGVKGNRTDIASPKDFDGKRYGAFGVPGEMEKVRAVIKGAGGRGEFETITIGGSSSEALDANRVDFADVSIFSEGLEAELRGQPYKTFKIIDYGFPDAYGSLLVANSRWLTDHPDLARAFVHAAQRGYQLAADDPAKAAQHMMAANPGVFPEPELVKRRQQLLAQLGYLKDKNGRVGTQTLEQWTGNVQWLFANTKVSGPDGNRLAAPPDIKDWFTNEYLAK